MTFDWLSPAIGFTVGLVWTVVFGPLLNMIPRHKERWFAYGVEAAGVFIMSLFLHGSGQLTPIHLLSSMISAGIGMFVAKILGR
jgi:hypothetical protein